MARKYSDFTKEDCTVILNSILENEKHIDNQKTLYFLNKLKNVDKTLIIDSLKYSEIFFHYIKSFFNFDRDEKMFFMYKATQDFKKSELTCCLQVLDHENINSIVEHTLSLEHFLSSKNIDNRLLKPVEVISEYFFATGNVNTNELLLLHELMNENIEFVSLIKKTIKK